MIVIAFISVAGLVGPADNIACESKLENTTRSRINITKNGPRSLL